MSDFLIHYGVQGQKWGERRYQYQDGSYTPEGRTHYGIGDTRKNIRQLGAKMNRSQYMSNFAATDLFKIQTKNNVVKRYAETLN